jgi:hypothetical protein
LPSTLPVELKYPTHIITYEFRFFGGSEVLLKSIKVMGYKLKRENGLQ